MYIKSKFYNEFLIEFKKANKNFIKTKNQLAKLEPDADPEKRETLEKQLEKFILDLNYIEVYIVQIYIYIFSIMFIQCI